MFEKITPEEAGVSSSDILSFVKMLDEYEFNTHSIIMTKGDNLFFEAYYKPFKENFIHRMYSVSKTFIAVAVGLAITEGLLKPDDIIADFFPEFKNDTTDSLYDECTIMDMLTMQSNLGVGVNWWGKFEKRVGAYYSRNSHKVPGIMYWYDSIGSFLLGCIIEKLTGMDFLEYLKEKVLLKIGFSKESFTLREPGGFTVGDSGVMCTARDLALFARFIMKKGEWDGVRYIDRDFMEKLTTKQVDNSRLGDFNLYNSRGYGYLTWITDKNGFSLIGMGDQLAVCDFENDFMFVITSDNQANRAARHIIYHELYRHFIPKIKKAPLKENKDALNELLKYKDNLILTVQRGDKTSSLKDRINNITYSAMENSLGISYFKVSINEDEGEFIFKMNEKEITLPFKLGDNKLCKFSFGKRAKYDMMGVFEDGEYDCAVSAAWADEHTLSIKAQVIDTYFGCLRVYISFADDRAVVKMVRSGQYVFDGMEGYVIGIKK